MQEEPSSNWSEGIKRFLADLRSGAERRSWKERRGTERRAGSADVDTERRDPEGRRHGDRRVTLLDRRRKISEPYAQQHAERIREMLLNSVGDVGCPRCGGRLLLGPRELRGSTTAREVLCTSCRHSVVITGLPTESAPTAADPE
jgi:DNA-directed RNA polymerase subunit RPC12/RpoP